MSIKVNVVKEKYDHWFARFMRASAVTIGHTVYYALPEAKVTERLRRHERIHVRQYAQLGTLGFLLRYLGEYLNGRLKGKDHKAAYLAISYEKEAFNLENRDEL